MRLIDATALHRELVVEMVKCLRMSEETKGSMAERVLNKVDEAPTIEVPQWIPVTERLPEKTVRCLVYGSGGGTYTAEFRKYEGGHVWHKLNSKSHYCNPTHWMPLPKPPEMDGGAE